MKKLAFIALAACVTLVSCNDDDSVSVINENPGENVSVDGTWNLTSVTSAEAIDANMDGTASTDFIAETGCFDNSNIIFAQNNTAELNLEVPVLTSCIATTTDATYAVNGNTVTFSFADEDIAPETMSLSGNTLTIETPYEVEIEINGQSQIISYDMTLIYTKQ